jgi:tRNA G18 (ribose-2'-O)-methylase SpoU
LRFGTCDFEFQACLLPHKANRMNRKLKNSELNRKNVAQFKAATKMPIIVVLDNIRSLNNIGSVFRTADAFLIEKIYLCGITAQPPHKDIKKTALGATDAVAWEYVEDAITLSRKLKEQSIRLCAIEQAEDSVSLQNFQILKNQKYAVVFGNEVKGVQQEIVSVADTVIEIPQFGTKHSLNISVSCGVVLWDMFSKMNI